MSINEGSPEKLNSRCPVCDSDDWKLLSVVYLNAVTHVLSETRGSSTFIGAGSAGVGIGLGWEKSATAGEHRTGLATLTAPPAPPNEKRPNFDPKGSFFFGWSPEGWKANQERLQRIWDAYDSEKRKWDETRMCQRCGAQYVPPVPEPKPEPLVWPELPEQSASNLEWPKLID